MVRTDAPCLTAVRLRSLAVRAVAAAFACALMLSSAAFAVPEASGTAPAEADRKAVANPIAPSVTPEEAMGGGSEQSDERPLEDPNNIINTGQLPDSSFLYDTSIAALAGADSYFDGQEVQVTGEAVGEAIKFAGGDEYYWVVLAAPEDSASIITFMRASDVRKIDTFGAYGKTGTTLKVRGTFNLVCKEHEGESDLHVTSVAVVGQGSEHPDVFDIDMFIPGAVLVVAGMTLMVVFWYLRERKR